MVIGNVPTNDFSCVDIDDSCEVPETVYKPEIGEIPSPNDVRSDRADDFEDVFDPCFLVS